LIKNVLNAISIIILRKRFRESTIISEIQIYSLFLKI
jgi:hypothetical protein